MNIKFDLIIANPPYGKPGANITKNIIDNVYFEEYVNLLPANDYKRNDSKDLFKYAREMENINDGFKDAAVTTHLCKIAKEPNNITLDEFEISNYIDRSLDKYFTENRNRNHYAIDNSSSNATRFNDTVLQNTLFIAHRTAASGHFTYKKNCAAYQINNNLVTYSEAVSKYGLTNDKQGRDFDAGVIIFDTIDEKLNCSKFIYSKDGFRFMSKILTALNCDSWVNIDRYLPKVDWTRSWTVEEILKDYGYTDIEIKNIMEDLDNFKGMDN